MFDPSKSFPRNWKIFASLTLPTFYVRLVHHFLLWVKHWLGQALGKYRVTFSGVWSSLRMWHMWNLCQRDWKLTVSSNKRKQFSFLSLTSLRGKPWWWSKQQWCLLSLIDKMRRPLPHINSALSLSFFYPTCVLSSFDDQWNVCTSCFLHTAHGKKPELHQLLLQRHPLKSRYM